MFLSDYIDVVSSSVVVIVAGVMITIVRVWATDCVGIYGMDVILK